MNEFRPGGPLFQEQDANLQDLQIDWGDKEWGTHRFHIRGLIHDTVSKLTQLDRAAVLGAGNHGDVNLPELAGFFQQLTIIDTETNGIEEWAEGQSGGLSHRLKSLAPIDYTRQDQAGFYEDFEDLLQRQAPASRIVDRINQCAYEVLRYEVLPQLKRSFPLAVSSGVYTQLFYIEAMTRFAEAADSYAPEEAAKVVQALRSLRNQLVIDYNKLLLSLVKPGGCVAAWSEIVLMEADQQAQFDQLQMLADRNERTKAMFQFMGRHGIEPALLAVKDLHDRLQPGSIMMRCWVWNNDNGKVYLTAGLSGLPR